MSKWWQKDNLFFTKEKEHILQKYPSLIYCIENDIVKLKGELPILEIDDSYSIEIEFPDNYPKNLPIVKEVSGDIPKELDLHISYDGSCCLCIPQLEKFYFPDGSNIITFLEKLVIPFFANQAYFKITGTWLNGEYGHGEKGIYEFYSDILQTNNIHLMIIFMILSLQEIKNINTYCPCSSGKSIKKCHLQYIKQLAIHTSVHQIKTDITIFKKITLTKEVS